MDQTFAILVMIDIVDSTKTTEKLGDLRMSKKMRLYDRIARGLLIKWNGLEIDRTDGYLLLFETMREALQYTMEYHRLIEKHTGFLSRVGIHAGVVIMHSNDSFFVSRGAKPIEIEGIQKSICARIMSLAEGGQTLLSNRAGQITIGTRQNLKMADIGKWMFKGVNRPMQLYAISWEASRLVIPRGNRKVKLAKKPKLSKAQRRRQRIRRYLFYPSVALSLYLSLKFTASFSVFYPFSSFLRNIGVAVDLIESLFKIETYINLIEWFLIWFHHYYS